MKNIFNSIYAKSEITEIKEWIEELNQSAMFGIFRRDYLSKARLLLALLKDSDISEKKDLRNFISRINSENYSKL